jgi:hypothetical protein
MKKLLLIFFLLTEGCLLAQVPMFFNTNAAGGQNSIPFNSGGQMVWRRAQFCIPAGNLGAVPPGNNITVIYFQAGSTANVTYPSFTVRLKTAGPTGMVAAAASPFESGMTQVFQANNFVMSTVTGAWYGITLQTPFLYNPAMPLIVDFEHSHTAATGPTVMQPGIIALVGSNGRQWGDIAGAPISGVGTQQLNFGIDVLPATPCAGTPGPNTVVTPTAPVCPNNGAQLSLATTYSFGGITYQWQYSNVSAVGPWTNVPNGNSNILNTPTLNVAHYFNTIITCTNSNGSITATSGTVNVASTTTNNVPYYEGFEQIGTNNRLPNCSWISSNLGTTCLTYTNVQTMNRSARSGGSYGSFFSTPANSNYFWTNGIWLEAGVTYSAATWYKTTEANANPVWQLRMWVSSAQSTTAIDAMTIASTGGAASAISSAYMPFSNTFSVASAGYYHVGINANSTGAVSSYLSWDDLEVTLPCQLNPVSVALSASSQTICAGTNINITATGADTYLWNTGATGPAIAVTPYFTTTYSVTGTNALTGCSTLQTIGITVLPTPMISALSNVPAVCVGNSVNLFAIGNAATYLWSNSATGANINVTPAATTAYTVIGSNSFGCSASAVVNVVVNPLPVITAGGDNSGIVCQEDQTILSANGAVSYQWVSPTSFQLGNPVTVSPNQSTSFTVTGTNQNGCSGTAVVALVVAECVGIKNVSTTAGGLKLYPNPNTGNFVIEVQNNKENTIEVSDLSGRVLLQNTTRDEKINVDLSQFANGVYYVKMTSDSYSEVIKVVKH